MTVGVNERYPAYRAKNELRNRQRRETEKQLMIFKNEKKQKAIEYNPYKYHPAYCKACGEELLRKREVNGKVFNERTGEPIEVVRYVSFCPLWQIAGHTNHWGPVKRENEQGKEVGDYWW